MADSCATCFFFRAYSTSRPEMAGIYTCRRDAPNRSVSNNPESPWVIVKPDEWCGDGRDMTTGRGFAADTGAPVVDAHVISDSPRP